MSGRRMERHDAAAGMAAASPRAVVLPDGRTDLYPTRSGDRATITLRRDPVVHDGDGADAVLDPSTLRDFARDGYLFLDSFFDDGDVAVLLDEVGRLSREADSEDERVIRETRSNAVRSLFAVHEGNDVFARIVRHPRLVGMARQILGGPVYVHQSRVNLQPAFVGTGFYWHSDFETWHAEDGMPRMRAVSLSIALTPNTPCNGPLMVMPGSHHYFVSCVGDTPDDHYKTSLRRQDVGTPDHDSLSWLHGKGGIAAPTGPAGSILVFDCNTMHGSNSNISPLPRTNLFVVYNSVENALEQPFAGTSPRPDFIGHRNVAPLEPLA